MAKFRRVLVGLGNPEDKYLWSRHNVGYNVMDALAEKAGAAFSTDETLTAATALYAPDVLLVKPLTGMNDSGLTVKALVENGDVDVANLLLVYDDVSIPTSRLRFKFSGSAGGHHGIESVIEQLSGNRDFGRLKVAVGPDPGGAERYIYVVSPLHGDEREKLELVASFAGEACIHWLETDMAAASSRFNGAKAF